MQGIGDDTPGAELPHLILHQGDEGGDDDRHAAAGQAGHLEADGLSPAGRQ